MRCVESGIRSRTPRGSNTVGYERHVDATTLRKTASRSRSSSDCATTSEARAGMGVGVGVGVGAGADTEGDGSSSRHSDTDDYEEWVSAMAIGSRSGSGGGLGEQRPTDRCRLWHATAAGAVAGLVLGPLALLALCCMPAAEVARRHRYAVAAGCGIVVQTVAMLIATVALRALVPRWDSP